MGLLSASSFKMELYHRNGEHLCGVLPFLLILEQNSLQSIDPSALSGDIARIDPSSAVPMVKSNQNLSGYLLYLFNMSTPWLLQLTPS